VVVGWWGGQDQRAEKIIVVVSFVMVAAVGIDCN